MQDLDSNDLALEEIKSEICAISERLALIEHGVNNIERMLSKIELQTSVMENHVVNVETVISSTPFTTSIFRALNWRTIPQLLYRNASLQWRQN